MARFETKGMDALIETMESMGQTTGELAEKILMAGAEQIKQCWKKAAEMKKVKLTGQLIESIGYSRTPKKIGEILSIDIYPQGSSTYTEDKKTGKRIKRKKAVRNAEIAFVNHYGTTKHPGTHFIDLADDLSGPAVESETQRLLDEWIGENSK